MLFLNLNDFLFVTMHERSGILADRNQMIVINSIVQYMY